MYIYAKTVHANGNAHIINWVNLIGTFCARISNLKFIEFWYLILNNPFITILDKLFDSNVKKFCVILKWKEEWNGIQTWGKFH